MICHNKVTAHPSLCTITIRWCTNMQLKFQPAPHHCTNPWFAVETLESDPLYHRKETTESLKVCTVTYRTEVDLDEPGHENLQLVKTGLVRQVWLESQVTCSKTMTIFFPMFFYFEPVRSTIYIRNSCIVL